MMNSLAADRWTLVAVATAIVALVAVLGGLATEIGDWYEGLNFPSWRPPNWLFGPAWTLIFVLTATSGVLAWEQAPDDAARVRLLGALCDQRRAQRRLEPAVLQAAPARLGARRARPPVAVDPVARHRRRRDLDLRRALARCPISPGSASRAVLNWRMVELNKPFATYWPKAKRPAERA